jgi:phosphoesterase RecJ-like protein
MQTPESQQQLFDLLGKSQRILIALPANPNGDTLGGSLAFAAFLKKMGKQVEVYCQKADFGNLSFLPGINEVKHEIVFSKSFVISVQTSKAKLDELSYNVLKDKINIYLKPQSGNFAESDVSYSSEFAGYDLIVCIDTPSLESLGALYDKNAEMFFQTPKVNIDNHINNDNYANINIVDVTASSTSEILLELLKKYEAGLIDANIATNLLTGIITETNSFQHNKTTPDSFLKASELISFGARQQEIIRNLFKTKELAVLKLWGRAMARIKALTDFSAMFSVVGQQDILKSEADENTILKVAEDFFASMADSKINFFVAEKEGYLDMYISANPNIKLRELVNYFGGDFISDAIAKAKIQNHSVIEVEKLITDALTELKPRLGL